MALQPQLRSSELVAFITINNKPLGLFSEVPIPEPDSDTQTYPKPLQDGSFSAGGEISLKQVEASRVFDPNTDEALLAFLTPLQGGRGVGVCAYHPAPGKVPRATPLANQTYDVSLDTVMISGVNADGGDITMLTVSFTPNGIGR